MGAAVALAGHGCATNPATGETYLSLMSSEDERDIGARFDKRLRERGAIYGDEAVNDYVAAVGDHLARGRDRRDLDYTFRVVDSPAVNAFALPGGYVYVTRGILAHFNDQEDLAGVLAHEIAHVEARHGVQQQSWAKLSSMLGLTTVAAIGGGDLAALALRVGQSAALADYSREHELQADRLAGRYLVRAGYPADAMIDVLEVLEDLRAYQKRRCSSDDCGRTVYHAVFASHPSTEARLEQAKKAAVAVQGSAVSGGEAPQQDYLEVVGGLAYGVNPDRPMAVDGRVVWYEHNAAVTYPESWQLERQGQGVRITEADQRARLSIELRSAGGERDPRVHMQRASEARLRSSSGEYFRVDGSRAYSAVAVKDTSAGLRRIRHITVVREDMVWHFLGIARLAKQFELFDTRVFTSVARSLSPMRDDTREKLRPQQLAIVDGSDQRGFDNYAERALRLDGGGDRLRLLNGLWPNGVAPADRRFKIVVPAD